MTLATLSPIAKAAQVTYSMRSENLSLASVWFTKAKTRAAATPVAMSTATIATTIGWRVLGSGTDASLADGSALLVVMTSPGVTIPPTANQQG